MADKSELQLKVNVNVEDALKGLKAFQRELKETIKLQRELEAGLEGEYKAREEFSIKGGDSASLMIYDKNGGNRDYSIHVPSKIVVYY